ncbi:MAG: 4-hydroxythreonine-4-phosphate dehydrogenase PdxA [Deltaproteobacteria bacterium]|nr:MAG: 4-hydroxythreonine-4-phosphate dehydrogenase PdxA [Deltaproteobacteria bacterium]
MTPSSSEPAVLAITAGDIAGVGPELIWRSVDALRTHGPCLVVGDLPALEAARRHLAAADHTLTRVRAAVIDTPRDAAHVPPGVLPVLQVRHGELTGPLPPPVAHEALPDRTTDAYPWGQPLAAAARLQLEALCQAIDLALDGAVAGIVTAPWDKGLLGRANLPPTGHTEVLAERSGRPGAVMLLAGDLLRVALATAHIPLSAVPSRLTTDGLVATLATLHDGLVQDFGIPGPHIAVCGLNPHAGEGGVLGDEDDRIIAPAVERARNRGYAVSGPWPADTLFPRIVAGRFAADAVLAMYHDQGLVPLKTVHFGESANITLGLPFVRTSVDHGTARDIAGRGVADVGSFVWAIAAARRMVTARRTG